MTEKTRILFLSANPWTTSRILVDEEAREIFERLQEGPCRNCFELHKHSAIRPIDLQRLLMMYEPHIVHFSGHGSKREKIILGGTPGRGKEVDQQGLAEVFALYKNHVRLVVLNACFTKVQARSLSDAIDYSIGTGKGIGDKGGVAFAGAFYRALGFGRSVKEAFESAKAELGLIKMPRTKGIELFVRDGISEADPFPLTDNKLGNDSGDPLVLFANRLIGSEASDYQTRGRRTAVLCRDLILERVTERAVGKNMMLETPRFSQPGKRSKVESDVCLSAAGRAVFEMRAAPRSSVPELRAPRGWRSGAELKKSRKIKQARRVSRALTKNDPKPRSARLYSRCYVAVIVEVQTVQS